MQTCEETTTEVLVDILKERTKQDQKWGQQNHPIVHPKSTHADADLRKWVADICRNKCDVAANEGRCDWYLILHEEVAEAIAEAAKGDAKALRTELIQVAAVVVAMIECLDRNGL